MRAILHNHWLMAFSFNILKMCFLGNERMNVSFFLGEGSQWIWDEVVKQNSDRAIFIYALVLHILEIIQLKFLLPQREAFC